MQFRHIVDEMLPILVRRPVTNDSRAKKVRSCRFSSLETPGKRCHNEQI